MTETHAAFLIHVERKTAFLLLKKWLQTTQACGPLDQSLSPEELLWELKDRLLQGLSC